MDLLPTYQSEKLYKFLCAPGEMVCCGGLPLKSGVYITAVLDLLVGGMRFIELLYLITGVGLQVSEIFLLFVLQILAGLVAVPFAVIGLIGIRNVQQPKLHIYSVYKQWEIPALVVIMVLHDIVFCEDFDCNQVVFFLFISLRVLFNLYFTHIVWSADLRLQHNETVLVLHGKDVLMLMREQARALAPTAYVVAEAGQVIGNPPVGTPVQPYSSY